MKIAIVYASKHGTAEKVAVSIAEKLRETGTVDLFSLKKNPKPDIHGFDTVILGSSVYAGQASKKMKAFCKANETVLLNKKTGMFVCGMHPDNVEREKELENAYPEALQKNSVATGFLGGEFLFERMNFVERFIIKKIAKTTDSVSQIDWEAVYNFVNSIKT